MIEKKYYTIQSESCSICQVIVFFYKRFVDFNFNSKLVSQIFRAVEHSSAIVAQLAVQMFCNILQIIQNETSLVQVLPGINKIKKGKLPGINAEINSSQTLKNDCQIENNKTNGNSYNETKSKHFGDFPFKDPEVVFGTIEKLHEFVFFVRQIHFDQESRQNLETQSLKTYLIQMEELVKNVLKHKPEIAVKTLNIFKLTAKKDAIVKNGLVKNLIK